MTLVLPAARESTASATKKALEFRAERSRVDMGHALLVEDDDQVAAATGEMFEHLGWRITRVASAQAALDAFADVAKIDLVFSDVMMPGGKSGIDLAAELRRRRPNLPIVLASGYAAPVRRQATELGVPLLPKPFNLDTLAAIIEVARLA
jgi:CheY-like chemotaxis protein